MVAVTMHVPAEVVVNTGEPLVVEIEQPVAVPEETVYDTAPVPEPPEVERANEPPYVAWTEASTRPP